MTNRGHKIKRGPQGVSLLSRTYARKGYRNLLLFRGILVVILGVFFAKAKESRNPLAKTEEETARSCTGTCSTCSSCARSSSGTGGTCSACSPSGTRGGSACSSRCSSTRTGTGNGQANADNAGNCRDTHANSGDGAHDPTCLLYTSDAADEL